MLGILRHTLSEKLVTITPTMSKRGWMLAVINVYDQALTETLDIGGLGKIPWLAVLCVYCHTSWPGGDNTVIMGKG